MVNGYSLDPNPQANFAKEQFAVVRILRLKRDRVPASNVNVVDDLQAAMEQSNPAQKLYAAKVMGPARSSEGALLYYILDIYNAS